MGLLVNDKGFLFHETGTHAIGALNRFAPDCTQLHAGVCGCIGKLGITDEIEQDTVSVSEHDGMPGSGQLLVEIGHLHPGNVQQAFISLQTIAQILTIDNDRFGRHAGIESVFVPATPPGSECQVVYFGGVNDVAVVERSTHELFMI